MDPFSGEMLPVALGGLLSSSRGVVEIDKTGRVTLECRKPKNMSYKESLELFENMQSQFGSRIYKDIETVAGRGLFVANDEDAIVIMRKVCRNAMPSLKDRMQPVIEWWDSGKPQGAPLDALMKEVNDPLKPAVLQSKLDGNESCAYCEAKESEGKKLKRCGGCGIPVYCCKECQERDWRSHKPLCKATRKLAKINFM